MAELSKKVKAAVEEYQCSGCVGGSDTSCYEAAQFHAGCERHVAGTIFAPHIGSILLGMPKGFNRLGLLGAKQPICIFKTFADSSYTFDKYNVPVWKMVLNGHTFVRGISPRINMPFILVFLEDCADKIDCLEITEKDLEEMD